MSVADSSLTPETTSAALTIGADSADFSGNSSNSSVDATIANSLNSYDTIVGGNGTDTVTANITNVTLRPNMTAIENFVVDNDTGNATINMTDSDVANLTSQGSAATPTFQNLATVGSLSFQNTATAASVATAAATSGSSDDLAINVQGVTQGGSWWLALLLTPLKKLL